MPVSFFGGSFFVEPSWISAFISIWSHSIGIVTSVLFVVISSSCPLRPFKSFIIELQNRSYSWISRDLSLGATSLRPFLSAWVSAFRSLALLFASFSGWFRIRISLTYFPICLWIFDFVNIMPLRGSKSPLAPSSKPHTFLHNSTGESPLIKTTRACVPVEPSEQRVSWQRIWSSRWRFTGIRQSSWGWGQYLRWRQILRRESSRWSSRQSAQGGYDPNSSIDENNSSFLSGVGSSVSSTPSHEKAIRKKKVQSDSPDSRDSDEPLVTMSSTQQVLYRKGQPTATPILIYEDTRREVVQQCIANLMSTVYLYPHSEVIASSFTDRFDDLLAL